MKKLIKSIIPVLILVFILLLPCLTLANDAMDKLKDVGGDGGYKTQNVSLGKAVSGIIQPILSLLGIIFLGLIIYAGINWMIAAGSEDKVTKAKDTIRRAIIGLIIVVGAYAISQFVIYSLAS